MTDSSSLWDRREVIEHTQCLAASLKHWTGRDLLPGVVDPEELARVVFQASFVLVSHGTEADPILNYGNQAALTLWKCSWEEFTRMPSRFTAEAPNRAERARLLEQVARDGFIDNYCGVRVNRLGQRFIIPQAIVWNLLSPQGTPCGQAAMFSDWLFSDEPARADDP